MSKMPLAGRSRIFSFMSGNGFNGEHGMYTFQHFWNVSKRTEYSPIIQAETLKVHEAKSGREYRLWSFKKEIVLFWDENYRLKIKEFRKKNFPKIKRETTLIKMRRSSKVLSAKQIRNHSLTQEWETSEVVRGHGLRFSRTSKNRSTQTPVNFWKTVYVGQWIKYNPVAGFKYIFEHNL